MSKVSRSPLFKHRNGQWAKKFRGKLRYFGIDEQAALEQWAADRDYLLAGKEPPRHDDRPTLKELANLFDARCRSASNSARSSSAPPPSTGRRSDD